MTLATPDSSHPPGANDWRFAAVGLVALLVLGTFTAVFQYRNSFSEFDLDWIMMGLLDGATSGLKTSSPMHYAITAGFGFYETFYALFSQATLTDSSRLTVAINNFGWGSAIVAVIALWLALALVEDKRTATIVAALFALNAVFLEASTSGHPFLFASAVLFLGACFLWAPVTGLRRVVCLIVAGVLFSYSLAIRADGFLAFPWLVLMRPNLANTRSFIVSSVTRALPLLAALSLFFVMQSFYTAVPHGPVAVQGSGGALSDFFQSFYRLSRILTGVAYLVLTAGIVTTLATVAAAVWLAVRLLRLSMGHERRELAAAAIGISALLIPNLAFWLPNPAPSRHFAFCVIGFGLCLGTVARRYNCGPGLVAFALAATIVANETLSELVRPRLLALMVKEPINFGDERPTHPAVPLGYVWRHHRSLQAAQTVRYDQATQLAAICGQNIVFSNGGNLRLNWLRTFYSAGRPNPRLSWGKSGSDWNLTIHRGNRELIYVFSYGSKVERETLKQLYPDAILVEHTQNASNIAELFKETARGAPSAECLRASDSNRP